MFVKLQLQTETDVNARVWASVTDMIITNHQSTSSTQGVVTLCFSLFFLCLHNVVG